MTEQGRSGGSREEPFSVALDDAQGLIAEAMEVLEQAREAAPKGPDSRVARRIDGWAVALDLVRAEVRRLHGQVATTSAEQERADK